MLQITISSKPPCKNPSGTKPLVKKSTRSSQIKIPKEHINVFAIQEKGRHSEPKNSPLGTKITRICLTHQQLNEEFTRHYQDLLEYTEKAISALKRPIDATTMLSESYLHLHKCAHEITDASKMVSYCKNFIKMNLKWSNSPVLRSERTILIDMTRAQQDTYDVDPRAEEWIREWESNLKNIERRLWSLWYHQDLKKGREFSEHLNISISGSYAYIRQCKELEKNLRDFIISKMN